MNQTLSYYERKKEYYDPDNKLKLGKKNINRRNKSR